MKGNQKLIERVKLMQKDPYGALNERMEERNTRIQNKHGNGRADKSEDVMWF